MKGILRTAQVINPSFKRQVALNEDIYMTLKFIEDRLNGKQMELGLETRVLLQLLECHAESFNPFNDQIMKKLDEMLTVINSEKSLAKKYPSILNKNLKLLDDIHTCLNKEEDFKKGSSITLVKSQLERSPLLFDSALPSLGSGNASGITVEKIKADELLSKSIQAFLKDGTRLGVSSGFPNFRDMSSVYLLPGTSAELFHYLVNLTSGKAINRPKYGIFEDILAIKQMDVFLQRPEVLEEDKDLRPNQLALKKRLSEVSKQIRYFG